MLWATVYLETDWYNYTRDILGYYNSLELSRDGRTIVRGMFKTAPPSRIASYAHLLWQSKILSELSDIEDLALSSTTSDITHEYVDKVIKHRKAFLTVEQKLFQGLSVRGYLHDFDKILLAAFSGHTLSELEYIHRQRTDHHLVMDGESGKERKRVCLLEAIINWECARETQPEKPFNAYDVMRKYFMSYSEELLPILSTLRLDRTTIPNVDLDEMPITNTPVLEF